MVGVMTLHRTTIGKKVIMAITGAVWIGYLLAHMYGNLKIFTGMEHFNEYAAGLRTLGSPVFGYSHLLWIARIVLIATLVPHIAWAIDLSRRNRISSRDVKYAVHKKLRANPANRTMIFGGIAVALFIIYHLMHLTFGVAHSSFEGHDAYHNVVAGFQNPIISIVYLIALVAIAFHLYHGTWSLFQTLGIINKNYNGIIKGLAWIVALVIPIGFALVPLAVMFGLVS